MTDRATIRYPYRSGKGHRRRWGRWTGSRAEAFTAGSEALGGLTAHSLPEDGEARWAYTDAVTKARWVVSTGAVIMLGAALLARLPAAETETETETEPQRAKLQQNPKTWLDDAVNELRADGVTFTAPQPQQRDAFDELFDAWTEHSPAERLEDPT